MTAPDRTCTSRARCALDRHRPFAAAAATGVTVLMSALIDTPGVLLATGAALFILGALTDGLCLNACPACSAHRSRIEAHVNAHLPALALWHKVGRPWWRRLLTTIALGYGLALGGTAVPVVLLGLPPDPTATVVVPLAVFAALWWTGHHKRLHDLLSDVCPYCR